MHDHGTSDHHSMPDDDAYHLRELGMPKTDGHETKSKQHDLQTLFRWMLCRILLLDAHDNSCPYSHPRANSHPCSNNNSLPDYHALSHNRSIQLQKLLLPSWLHEG
jgi:hypothetical protein